MVEQRLQPVPEMIDGDIKVEETEIDIEEAEMNDEEVGKEEENEEFYERIEAPKFFDFTKPNPFRPDDRYWFCSRVGCDQKHEEEIDPEEISKNFVLRVLAARSPNIKLQKALNGKHSSMKCPLSAPAKPSRSRIPRLAMASSSISHKIGDPQSKIRAPPKVSSTPVAKSRQVAAKYMTTPRNKKCLPNPNSFRSIQNHKTTTVHVPKNLTVAKALVFHSPKKAISVKKSIELHTPLTKICEGMKRLEIKSQKTTLKGIRSNPRKPEIEDPSRRQLRICKGEKKSKDLIPSKSKETQNKKILTHKCHPLHKQVIDNESNDMDVYVSSRDGPTFDFTNKEEGLQLHETSDTSLSHLGAEMNALPRREDKENTGSAEDRSNEVVAGHGSGQMDNDDKENALNSDTSLSHALGAEMDALPSIEDKENIGSAEDRSNEVVAGYGSGQMDNDDKENALNSEDNSREFNNQPLGDTILGKETHKKNKVVQTPDRNLKGGTSIDAGPAVVKYKKPKPTNVKPFRLRTDERGILREAVLERKLHFHAPEKEVAKDSVIKRTYFQKSERFSIEQNKCNNPIIGDCGKKSGRVTSTTDLKISRGQVGSKPANHTRRIRLESTQQRPRSMTNIRTTSLYLQGQSRGAASPRKVRRPGQKLSVIKEKSSEVTSDVIVTGNKTAASAGRSTSRGKRPVTIAKEPNFHSSHLPRSCSKKIA